MRRFREIIGCLLTFAAWMLGLYLLLVFCVTVPNSAIRVNMYSSAKLFLDTEPYAFPEDGSYRAVADNYADQIWTNIAWHMGEGEPFSAALDTSYYDGGDLVCPEACFAP